LGDGHIARVVVEVQRAFWSPPLTHPGKYD